MESRASKLLIGTSMPVQFVERLRKMHDQLEIFFRASKTFNFEHGHSVISQFGTDLKSSSVGTSQISVSSLSHECYTHLLIIARMCIGIA